MLDSCLEPGIIEVLKMLDSQTKSTISQNNLQVQHQARNVQPKNKILVPYTIDS
jgi:hypothetical protein